MSSSFKSVSLNGSGTWSTHPEKDSIIDVDKEKNPFIFEDFPLEKELAVDTKSNKSYWIFYVLGCIAVTGGKSHS
jgi:hypothetical protein